MNRRGFLKSANSTGLALALPTGTFAEETQQSEANRTAATAANPNTILLKDYRPRSLHKVPVTQIDRAKFSIIDMHSHPYAKTEAEIATWVEHMGRVNVAKTIILTMTTGKRFDALYAKYKKYPDRFDLWCGLDFSNHRAPGFPATAVKELQRCHDTGAKGIGEIHDKGEGLSSGESRALGLHPDDSRMDAIWEKAAELRMPVSLHVADPIWMYQPMDKHNDGLMNAFDWRLDDKPDIVRLPGMIEILERTAARHRQTTFVACHYANLESDLTHLGQVFERNPNVYADISARYGEIAPTPRFAAQFYAKYSHRLFYGTDFDFYDKEQGFVMYPISFRILESQDEHFYEIDRLGYHWPLYGLGLSDEILKKVYHENASKLLGRT